VLLSAKGRQATVGQVLRTTEGDIPMIECEDQDGNCPLDSFCRLRNVLADAREAFYAAVDDVVSVRKASEISVTLTPWRYSSVIILALLLRDRAIL